MNKLIVVCGVVAALGCGGGKGGNDNGTGGGGGGTTGAAGTVGAGGTGGTGACVMGREGCACYGNDSCDVGLQCLSHLCVALTGTGGSATGTAGTTGAAGSAAGTAGTTGSGGGGATGAAGTTGAGGSPAGTAGTTGAGGTGACATGSEGCACYGNDTCNGSLRCLSHLCVSLGGTAGTSGAAGTTGSAGTTGTAGTTGGAGRGGTTGSAGTTGTGGGAGNTLLFMAGVVSSGSNAFGISGGVYTFSDGAGSTITPDCTTDTCFADVTGVGPVCVSGTGARVLSNGVSYDYATYWGAALAMDLNNPTNAAMAQMAYKASDHGVTGFQFTFQNKASSTVRLSYKVRDPSTNALVEYCLDLTTATSIVHFTDARQSCYLASPGPALTAAMADHVEGIQWQVPTNISATSPFSYCISNLTPITQ